jgi:hypothetical protein
MINIVYVYIIRSVLHYISLFKLKLFVFYVSQKFIHINSFILLIFIDIINVLKNYKYYQYLHGISLYGINFTIISFLTLYVRKIHL